MLKVVQVLAHSGKSWEYAAANVVKQASETVGGIKSFYIKEMEASAENGKIVQCRIKDNISLLWGDAERSRPPPSYAMAACTVGRSSRTGRVPVLS